MSGEPCCGCHPRFMSDGRLDEGHISVRFGDADRGDWTVKLDGRIVTDHCFEAYARAGEPGWVILYDLDDGGGRFVCEMGPHPSMSMHVGAIEIELRPSAAEATR